jgi:cysteine desulfurase/selenocysteine lyase
MRFLYGEMRLIRLNVKEISDIRKDFPILSLKVYDKPLVYFDNGATTQKPRCVIDEVDKVLTTYNSNIHRGVHALSDKASEEYEKAREEVRAFINAGKTEEIVFTSGTTGSINAVAFSFGEKYIGRDDEIIVSNLEHHANIVPWQMTCERKGAKLRVIPINDNGEVLFDEYLKLLSKKTKLVAVTQASNALGTILPVKEIIRAAHSMDIPVLVDGAQGIQHGIVDVNDLDADFYVFFGTQDLWSDRHRCALRERKMAY